MKFWKSPTSRSIVATAFILFAPCSALAANGSVVYSYDPLGRIISASYDTGVCIYYSYDAVGNRTSQTIRIGGAGSVAIWGCFNWNQAVWGP